MLVTKLKFKVDQVGKKSPVLHQSTFYLNLKRKKYRIDKYFVVNLQLYLHHKPDIK